MKVLFIIPYVPSLVRVRSYNIIRSLAERGHQVTLLTLWTNEQERAEASHLQHICHEVHALHMPLWRSLWNCILALPGRDPLQTVYSWSPKLLQSILNGKTYDIVHVEHIRGARYALSFKEHTNLPVVWDSVDCITHLFDQAAVQSKDRLRRWRSKFELERTRRYEARMVNQFSRVLVTSTTDKNELIGLSGNNQAPITVIPNGVDLHYFRPDNHVTRDSATLIVSGKMSYHANIDMTLRLVQEIMPIVWQDRPDVKLLIVGKNPTREIQNLGLHPNIVVTGMVDHLPPYLQRATIAVAPISYNAGIQNKVLEAMACGTPVVTTPQAVTALSLKPGHDLLVANEAHTFAKHILALLSDPAYQRRIGSNGRTYVENHHDWSQIAARLEQIYAEMGLPRAEHAAAPLRPVRSLAMDLR